MSIYLISLPTKLKFFVGKCALVVWFSAFNGRNFDALLLCRDNLRFVCSWWSNLSSISNSLISFRRRSCGCSGNGPLQLGCGFSRLGIASAEINGVCCYTLYCWPYIKSFAGRKRSADVLLIDYFQIHTILKINRSVVASEVKVHFS
jgi:hypothetical protein